MKSVETTSINADPASWPTTPMMTPPSSSSNTSSLEVEVPKAPTPPELLAGIYGERFDLSTSASPTTHNPSTSEPNYTSSRSVISGFSQAQMDQLDAYVKSKVSAEIQRQVTELRQCLDQKALKPNEELVSMLAKRLNVTIQASQQTTDDDTSEGLTSPAQPPLPAQASTELLTEIRPQDVGYFYPDYQSEQDPNSAVPSVGKYVYFRDVYMFVDWLKEFEARGKNVKSVISSCLRGSALIWYLVELSDEDRIRLHASTGLGEWYELLIGRFKLRTGTAIAKLTSGSSVYTLTAVKHTPPRVWAQYMLHLVRAADFGSTHSSLTVIWSQLDGELQHNVGKPTEQTTLSEFLEEMDSKAEIWYQMAHRKSSHTRSQPQKHYRIYYGYRYLQNYPINDRLRQANLDEVPPNRDCRYYEAMGQWWY